MNGCRYCHRSRSDLRLRGHVTTCPIRRHPSSTVSSVTVGIDMSKCTHHPGEDRWDCWACAHHSDEERGA